MADLSLFDLTGKRALVTGGAVGIGRACAVALAQAGAQVAIVDIDEKTGRATAQDIQDMGRDSLFVCCDITQKGQVQAMMSQVVQAWGGLDIGVNNAGIAILGADESLDRADWDRVIAVNLTGTFLCAQAQAQQMISQTPTEGKIINIASMSARIANCNASYDASKAGVVHMTKTLAVEWGAYNDASKAGVVHMTKTLAVEWGAYNINVNCISPSYVLTPMHASTPVPVRQHIREATPLGYVERPEDLYGAVIFLASAASDYVTGHDLLVDGGHTLNAWMAPLGRRVPPRVGPEQEPVQMIKDLDSMGVKHDDEGVNPDLHPEIAEAFKQAFDL
jgi:NAD(P)-dependent dehydrogenase (short-subunit alcohol dehydrogenase family)